MIDQAILDQASAAAWDAGIRVLQGYRFAATDEAHVSALLEYMCPRHRATIVDVGCGFGEVARLMHAERPDLRFVLVNQNASQLARVPEHFQRIQADMHDLPLADASADVVMFCYTLCHADDFLQALAEAARVGRRLFVYDYERMSGDDRLFYDRLNARALSASDFLDTARKAGWELYAHRVPPGDDSVFRAAYANDAEYDLIFNDIRPVIWTMRRD